MSLASTLPVAAVLISLSFRVISGAETVIEEGIILLVLAILAAFFRLILPLLLRNIALLAAIANAQ